MEKLQLILICNFSAFSHTKMSDFTHVEFKLQIMAINDAIKFIKESQKNKELRKEVNKLKSGEIFPKLFELGYNFNAFEFDEAVNLLNVQCQFQEDAEHLLQTSMWFKMQTGDPL